jgi:predicted MFS family arabinose efflux permease
VIAQAYGWRSAMAVAAAPAVLLIPAVLWLREPGQQKSSRSEGRAGVLLKIPALWWIAVSGALANFVLYSFSTFISPFLSRYHGLSVAQAGLWSGLGSGLAGIAGALLAGAAGDRVWGAGRLRLAALAALSAVLPAAAGISLPAGAALAATLLMMLSYGALQMYYGLVYAAIHDLVPGDLRATAMAAYLFITYVCGGAVGPLVTGRLSDHFATQAARTIAVTEAAKATGLQHAMYLVPVTAIALAAVLWQAGRVVRAIAPRAGSIYFH